MTSARSSVEIVDVINQETGSSIMANAHAARASIMDASQLMSQPGEDGVNRVDHKIDLPVEITLSVITRPDKYRDFYTQIKNAKSLGDIFIVQTKSATYSRMMISSIPFEETPDIFTAITMNINFVEVLRSSVARYTVGTVVNNSDTNTQNRGRQSGTEATQRQSSFLSRSFGGVV